MLHVRNKHTSRVDHLAPGAEGELPDSAPVRNLIKAGVLELIGGTSEEAPGLGVAPTLEEGRAMLAEIEARGARIRELEARVAELEAASAKKPPKASKPDPDAPKE